MGRYKNPKQHFVDKAREIYGDYFDYTPTVYISTQEKVEIGCPIHGIFLQKPYRHLLGVGCPHCFYDKKRKLVYGVGINDMTSARQHPSHQMWRGMLARCYSSRSHLKEPTYIECSVCDEWLRFSNFAKWFDDNYVEDYELDKDLIQKGNKVYSPETCCFIPHKINQALTNRRMHRGQNPIGVYCTKNNTYSAKCSIDGHVVRLGTYTSKEEAFSAYKRAKENYFKELAEKYYKEGEITERVYHALLDYKVEITD